MADDNQLMDLLKKIAVEQNYDTPTIQIKPISSGGANYSSKLYLATISNEAKDGLKLFLKAALANEKLRGNMMLKPYDSEKYFYTELLKTYRNLEEKHNVSERDRLRCPKYYGVDMTYLKEVLVLEDLTSKGFGSANRFQSVDWPYAAAAVTELAKLHALSMAYQHYHPDQFQKTVTIYPSGMFGNDENMKQYFNMLAKLALETVREENKEKLKLFLDKYSLTSVYDFCPALRRQVLIHMDFRPSNMLHRVINNDTNELIVVDYQSIQGGSPAIDLLNFVFTASDGPFRAKYYEKLVNHYHSELSTALARFGLDAEDKYPRKDLDFEMREKLRYGLMLSISVLPILTVPEDKAPSFEGVTNFADFKIEDTGSQYPKRLNEAVDDFIDWGIL